MRVFECFEVLLQPTKRRAIHLTGGIDPGGSDNYPPGIEDAISTRWARPAQGQTRLARKTSLLVFYMSFLIISLYITAETPVVPHISITAINQAQCYFKDD